MPDEPPEPESPADPDRVRAELIRVSRLNDLGKVVAGLAHEVHQPLAAIANYAAALRLQLQDPAALDTVGRIAEQADRARQIVQTLRDFAGGRGRQHQEEDLATILSETGALSLTQPNYAVRLVTWVGPDAQRVRVNRVELQQVLFNLMRNAIEAMQDGAERMLSVRAERQGERVEIVVADTGPGLPEALLGASLGPVISTKPEGLGVGLAICRMIVEAHGGVLAGRNRKQGGAEFRFSVPAA